MQLLPLNNLVRRFNHPCNSNLPQSVSVRSESKKLKIKTTIGLCLLAWAQDLVQLRKCHKVLLKRKWEDEIMARMITRQCNRSFKWTHQHLRRAITVEETISNRTTKTGSLLFSHQPFKGLLPKLIWITSLVKWSLPPQHLTVVVLNQIHLVATMRDRTISKQQRHHTVVEALKDKFLSPEKATKATWVKREGICRITMASSTLCHSKVDQPPSWTDKPILD